MQAFSFNSNIYDQDIAALCQNPLAEACVYFGPCIYCTRSNVTGFISYFMLYGRHPMLPVYIGFGVRTPDLTASTTAYYVKKLHKRLEWAYNTAQKVN